MLETSLEKQNYKNMKNIIEEKYSQAVKDINEGILQDLNKWYDYIYNLPIDQQVIYTVSIFDWQIKNGGFHQYFFNSYGIFTFITLKNLEQLKLFEVKKLLDKALSLVNYENWNEEEFKLRIFNNKIEKITNFDEVLFEELNNLDEIYYMIPDEQIYNSLVKYLKI